MKQGIVRLSFDISEEAHCRFKTGCVNARKSMKDCARELIEAGIERMEREALNEQLRKAIQESKEGKVSSLGSFAKYLEDEI